MDKLTKYQEIYEKNKELDKIFYDLYYHDDFRRKNRLELLVEIGELTNETKCFKYWSKKVPNIDLVKEEYADCLIMTLYFFGEHHLEIEKINVRKKNLDLIDKLGKLYKLASKYYFDDNIETIKSIFFLLLDIGYTLGMTDDDICDAVKRKIEKQKERLRNEVA